MQPKGDKGYDNNRARKDNRPNIKQTQPQNPKIPFNIDLPSSILDQIGPNAGQGLNVGQYSNKKRAITKLMSLQRNINISGKQGAFSNWSNVSEAPFESAQERRQVLMCVRINEDSQRILRTASQNRDIRVFLQKTFAAPSPLKKTKKPKTVQRTFSTVRRKKRLRSTPFGRKTVILAGRFGRTHQRVLNFVFAHWEDSAQLTTNILQRTHINHIDQENFQMPKN